ncbi:MAG: ABC transporter permease subunit [Betaproteobacteria bacterium]|nr:ABC transporter permease subunit [Betaproteobacteria bacterium]
MARAFILLLLPAWCFAQDTLTVGSKRFTESYILGEIVARVAADAGEARAVHKPGLGNTGIVFAALRSGAIDIYPEYTGTIAFEVLNDPKAVDIRAINRELAKSGLGVAVPLGFNNSYALAMLDTRAGALGIRSISDLSRHAGLALGLSHEFLNRNDGWPGLKHAYRLPFAPRGVDHGLAYEALAAAQIDVMDIYSTDAKIAKYGLRVLEDDLRFFPRYEAVLLYRLDVPQRFPATWAALAKLENRIEASRMIGLNAEAELAGKSFDAVAAGFVSELGGAAAVAPGDGPRTFFGILFGGDFWRLTAEHLLLVFASLAASMLAGIPLGVWAARSPPASAWILSSVGLLQTIPSLALLAFLIPLLGTIGTAPALVALFLYALLPIVRNTASGLADIPLALQEAARALGLPPLARLRLIELPLAARSVLAGIKTSAVINVGTATIAAFIGAGGYGERIAAGLARNDNEMLLAGAIPAAAMALLVQGLFDLLDRRLISEGLRA